MSLTHRTVAMMLPVTDVDRARTFYSETLGLDYTGTNDEGSALYALDGGSTLDRQTTGQRTWDVNTDGVAHYGLVPDWIEDIRLVGGDDVIDSLAGGAQMYLDTWSATRAWQATPNLAQGRSASASTTSIATIPIWRILMSPPWLSSRKRSRSRAG